jgi:cobalt-zinc-cadmium efflux system protein
VTGHSHRIAVQEGDRTKLYGAAAVTVAMVVVQFVGVALTGSLALLADTFDKVVDLAGVAVAIGVAVLAARPATSRRTWGLRRLEVLAGSARAIVMLVLSVIVVVQAINQLRNPPDAVPRELIWFGAFGLLANLVKLFILTRGVSSSFNMRAVVLDAWNDALGSIGVLVAAIVLMTTGYARADAIASIVIVTIIAPRALQLLRETANVLLEATPPEIDLDAIRQDLEGVAGVIAVHDLHAQLIDANFPTLSAHVTVDNSIFQDAKRVRQVLDQLEELATVKAETPIEHTTFQLEPNLIGTKEPMPKGTR